MATEVVHIVRQYFPSIGGMEEVVRNIARHQVNQHQHSVRIVTLDRLFRNSQQTLPAEDEVDGIPVTRLPYYGSSRYPLCPQILSHVNSADVVHVHGVDFFYDFLGITKWLHKRPLILSTHGGFFHTQFGARLKRAYFKSVTQLCAKTYNKVVATSNNDGAIFSEIIRSPKLEVIENGVDVEKFSNLGAKTLQRTMIYFGRWSENKGLRETLALFSQLAREDDQWRLIIAGREYDLTETQLAREAQRLGITDKVELVGNPSDAELRELIQQASYFICLSRHEGFGLAPIEAMSAGLIPILSKIPPFTSLIDSANIGMLTDTHTENFSQTLMHWHTQLTTAYPQMRQDAMQFAQRYAWPRVADRYVSLYNQFGASQ